MKSPSVRGWKPQNASIITNAQDECFYYIFSKSGFTDALLEKQDKSEVLLVTLEEMYGEKS